MQCQKEFKLSLTSGEKGRKDQEPLRHNCEEINLTGRSFQLLPR